MDTFSTKNTTPPPETFENFKLLKKDIIAQINELSSASASGLDNFPAIYLKECKQSLEKPLTMLWKQSLKKRIVPKKLKQTLITPVHKVGNQASEVMITDQLQ